MRRKLHAGCRTLDNCDGLLIRCGMPIAASATDLAQQGFRHDWSSRNSSETKGSSLKDAEIAHHIFAADLGQMAYTIRSKGRRVW